MEVVVAQPALCQSVQGRGVDGAPKGRGGAKADIVDQHDDHIGRALGCRHGEQGGCLDISYIEFLELRRIRFCDGEVCAVHFIGICR